VLDKSILLPGLNKQLQFLKSNSDLTGKKVLIIGAGSELIAEDIFSLTNLPVDIIVDNYDSLIATRLNIHDKKNISCSLMDFESTDFAANSFDLVFAQASVSIPNRKNILKEIFRILKPNSTLCIGEIIKLQEKTPPFISEIFSTSNLFPLILSELEKVYEKSGFVLLSKTDLTSTLPEYFKLANKFAKKAESEMNESEKNYMKKILNRYLHESNSFLKFGGDKYLGFYTFIYNKGV